MAESSRQSGTLDDEGDKFFPVFPPEIHRKALWPAKNTDKHCPQKETAVPRPPI